MALANESDPALDVQLDALLKVDDLERILRVDKRTIFRLCLIGQLPKPVRIGGSRRWKKQDIEMLINKLA